jgi:hypothetical protein
MWKRIKNIFLHVKKDEASVDVEYIRASGRDTFDYIRGDRRTTVYVELLTGQIKRRICVWSIRKWHPPYENEKIIDIDKRAIVRCLCGYFERKRISYDVLEGEPAQND